MMNMSQGVVLNPNAIIETISKIHGFSVIEVLYKKSRKRELTDCRQTIYYFLRKYIRSHTRNSLPIEYTLIAKIFKKNHATIIIGIRKVEDRIKFNKDFKNDIQSIDTALQRISNTNICPFCGSEKNHIGKEDYILI